MNIEPPPFDEMTKQRILQLMLAQYLKSNRGPLAGAQSQASDVQGATAGYSYLQDPTSKTNERTAYFRGY